MIFLKCDTRGCRNVKGLVLCAVCEALVCPAHAAQSAGEILCPECAPADRTQFQAGAQKPATQQQELFS